MAVIAVLGATLTALSEASQSLSKFVRVVRVVFPPLQSSPYVAGHTLFSNSDGDASVMQGFARQDTKSRWSSQANTELNIPYPCVPPSLLRTVLTSANIAPRFSSDPSAQLTTTRRTQSTRTRSSALL